ncbi:MAG: 50S ribosomal protein L14e [Nanoarchaeota archaeon]
MSIFEVGRLVMKIAGRDAGGKGVVIEQLDNIYVLVDGGLRRKKVNIKHLEPLSVVIELNAGAAHEEVEREFKKLGLPVWERKAQ